MRNLLVAASILALAGCNFAPKYVQPVAPVAGTYPDAAAPGGATGALATDLGWREFFGDERLRQLIATALVNNRDLAQSLARVAQARAQFRIENSARLPQLDLNGGYQKSRQPIGSLPIPGGPTAGSDASITLTTWSANVGVASFELDLWGRVRNLSDKAKAEYLSSVQGARSYRISLIAQVAAAYYTILSGEERIRLAEQTLTGRTEGVRIAKMRLDAGVTSTVDYDQTVLLATQARADLADLRLKTGQARNLLDVLVGGPIAATLPAPRSLSDSGQFARVDPGLPSALLLNRPDILEAEYKLLAANADIGAARAAFFPNITLTGQFGFSSPTLGKLFKGGSQAWSYGANLTLPIFDWGKRQAQLRLSKAQAAELTAAYQRAVQEGFREVADALIARRQYVDQIAALSDTVAAQQRLATTARRRYDQGLSIYLEVLDAERSLFAAQQQLIDLRSTSLQNDVSLYVALGGGLTERAADPVPPVDRP